MDYEFAMYMQHQEITKYMDRLFEEKEKYYEALNEIKDTLETCKKLMPHEFDWEEQTDNILEKIDKVLGGR